MISFCFVQIGEAVNRLSEKFLEENAQIDWRSIYGLRCYLVHGYENMSKEIVWESFTKDAPILKKFCEAKLG